VINKSRSCRLPISFHTASAHKINDRRLEAYYLTSNALINVRVHGVFFDVFAKKIPLKLMRICIYLRMCAQPPYFPSAYFTTFIITNNNRTQRVFHPHILLLSSDKSYFFLSQCFTFFAWTISKLRSR
jgi:hypothetical protein